MGCAVSRDQVVVATAIAAKQAQEAKAAHAGSLKPVSKLVAPRFAAANIAGLLVWLAFIGTFVAVLMKGAR